MDFDWVMPHIKCRVVYSPDQIARIDSNALWFHRRAVCVDKIDTTWDSSGGEISLALVRVEDKSLWVDYAYLELLSASSECICSTERLMLMGCKCGGI